MLLGFIHPGAGLGQKAPSFGMQDPHPDLGQEPDGGLMDGFDLVVGQDPGRLEWVDKLPVPVGPGRCGVEVRGPRPPSSPGLGSDLSEHP